MQTSIQYTNQIACGLPRVAEDPLGINNWGLCNDSFCSKNGPNIGQFDLNTAKTIGKRRFESQGGGVGEGQETCRETTPVCSHGIPTGVWVARRHATGTQSTAMWDPPCLGPVDAHTAGSGGKKNHEESVSWPAGKQDKSIRHENVQCLECTGARGFGARGFKRAHGMLGCGRLCVEGACC